MLSTGSTTTYISYDYFGLLWVHALVHWRVISEMSELQNDTTNTAFGNTHMLTASVNTCVLSASMHAGM